MPDITTFLTFNDQAEEAARWYVSIFPNSEITSVSHYPDLGPDFPYPQGHVMLVDFVLNGRRFNALNGGPQFAFSQGISIAVTCETQDEVDEYWDKLTSDGGSPVACGWLTDKFGVSWQITPKQLTDGIMSDDPATAAETMKKMMTMTKIEIDQL